MPSVASTPVDVSALPSLSAETITHLDALETSLEKLELEGARCCGECVAAWAQRLGALRTLRAALVSTHSTLASTQNVLAESEDEADAFLQRAVTAEAAPTATGQLSESLSEVSKAVDVQYVVCIPDPARASGRREVTSYPEGGGDDSGDQLASDHVRHLRELGTNGRDRAYAIRRTIVTSEIAVLVDGTD